MISVIKLEKRMVDTSIFSIIVGKLCYGKKPCPIILLKVDKSLEINFYYTILPFSLIICLWVEGGRKSLLNV